MSKSFASFVREKFYDEVQKEFKFSIKGRLVVIADTEHYKASVDESVWLQKKGTAPTMFEVYWDNEWIIDFSTETEQEIVFALFWNGFYKAYAENRIRLNEGLAEKEVKDINVMIESSKKALKPAANLSPVEREAEKIIAEINAERKKEKDAIKTAPRLDS